MDKIIVRFAPSPTGFLHVGGARTAIFNWLFAKKNNGKFLIRIEDTDIKRSKSELSAQIIRSLNWLGLISDEPIVYQALNINRHREIALKLLHSGKAYYAFETPEELDLQRKLAQKNKIPYKYNRAALSLNSNTINKYLSEGKPYTIRFKIPEGVTEFSDLVHGKTVFKNEDIEDFIILRSDNSPVYMLAVVADDHDMNITHIIRGDDHLNNTPKQILLYNALSWKVPEFAHLPMIVDEQKRKLSKRYNTVSVEEYKSSGYLSEALFNFLTLLGYAPLNKKEIISKNELINEFSFERVNKKSAVFDIKKLNWINSEYIKSANANIILEIIEDNEIHKQYKIDLNSFSKTYVIKAVDLLKSRINKLTDIFEFGDYLFQAPKDYDKKGLDKYWTPKIKPIMQEFKQTLENINLFSSTEIELSLRKLSENYDIKSAELIHLLRLILTGKTVSPNIFEITELLGKNEVITRISDFFKKN
jgi:glutamyl-tRNA synthetase